uniref:Uncharacterized protein n=1 Tax=Panagrolaimus davidi TaxID=227884 RepID=A0A914P4E3_9BILA
MNPTTSALYQKMVQSSKYFYIKNPIIIVTDLSYSVRYGLNLVISRGIGPIPLDMTKLECKFWMIDKFQVYGGRNGKGNILPSIIPTFFRCDIKDLIIYNQNVSYKNWIFLASNAVKIDFCNVTVKNEDGSNIATEKLVEAAVNAKEITLARNLVITSKTVEELIKLPHFRKLNFFQLYQIPETFDIGAFFVYIKKNKSTNFHLYFNESISDEYKNRIDTIIDKILATKKHDYRLPDIYFSGISREKYDKFCYLRHCQRFT